VTGRVHLPPGCASQSPPQHVASIESTPSEEYEEGQMLALSVGVPIVIVVVVVAIVVVFVLARRR
jgi:hypothetical protein